MRQSMVAEVRQGIPQRAVARRFGVSLYTVQRWVKRARGKRLNRVEWSDRRRGPIVAVNRTKPDMEARILRSRQELRVVSDLGEYGAMAVHDALQEEGIPNVPNVRTIGRVFARYGLLDSRRRTRRSAPPAGWYLPEVVAGQAELDQVDIVEGLKIKDGPLIEVVNTVSLHGGLVGSWPQKASVTALSAQKALLAHWRQWGLPTYAQFDNDTIFQGPHHHPNVIGRVMRMCLSLAVVPVFVPQQETGFQASIENYNGQWQAKVWARFVHVSLSALKKQSGRYVSAHRRRTGVRRESAPRRKAIGKTWQLDLQAPPRGHIVFIRRTTSCGEITLLGNTFLVDPLWTSRLVRCDVLLQRNTIRFYRLRRRAPEEQPLLAEASYQLPRRPFRE